MTDARANGIALVRPVRLPRRLAALLAAIPQEGSVADIGTDHALLPAALACRGQKGRIIATDVHPGPLASAHRTLIRHQAGSRVILRQGNGLEPFLPGDEVDFLVIAGMGGRQILTILQKALDKLPGVRAWYCQPAQDLTLFRRQMRRRGFLPAREILVQGGKKDDVILIFHPQNPMGCGQAPGGRQDSLLPAEAILDEIGPCLWRTRPPGYDRHLKQIIARHRKILRDMRPLSDDLSPAAGQRLKKLRQKTARHINELEKCLQEVICS